MQNARWSIKLTGALLCALLLAGCAAPAVTPAPQAGSDAFVQSDSTALVPEPSAPLAPQAAMPSDAVPVSSDAVTPAADSSGAACAQNPAAQPQVEQPQIYALTGSIYLDDDRSCLICDPTLLAAGKTVCADPGATVSLSFGQGCFALLESEPAEPAGGRLLIDAVSPGRISLTLEAGTLTCFTEPDAAALFVLSSPVVELAAGTACTLAPWRGDSDAAADKQALAALAKRLYLGEVSGLRRPDETDEPSALSQLLVTTLTSGEDADAELLSDMALNFLCTLLEGHTESEARAFYETAASLRAARAAATVTGQAESGIAWGGGE